MTTKVKKIIAKVKSNDCISEDIVSSLTVNPATYQNEDDGKKYLDAIVLKLKDLKISDKARLTLKTISNKNKNIIKNHIMKNYIRSNIVGVESNEEVFITNIEKGEKAGEIKVHISLTPPNSNEKTWIKNNLPSRLCVSRSAQTVYKTKNPRIKPSVIVDRLVHADTFTEEDTNTPEFKSLLRSNFLEYITEKEARSLFDDFDKRYKATVKSLTSFVEGKECSLRTPNDKTKTFNDADFSNLIRDRAFDGMVKNKVKKDGAKPVSRIEYECGEKFSVPPMNTSTIYSNNKSSDFFNSLKEKMDRLDELNKNEDEEKNGHPHGEMVAEQSELAQAVLSQSEPKKQMSEDIKVPTTHPATDSINKPMEQGSNEQGSNEPESVNTVNIDAITDRVIERLTGRAVDIVANGFAKAITPIATSLIKNAIKE